VVSGRQPPRTNARSLTARLERRSLSGHLQSIEAGIQDVSAETFTTGT
jgi:hypothetical protein